MSGIEFIEVHKVLEQNEDKQMIIQSTGKEIYTIKQFNDLVYEKKKKLNERASHIEHLKKRIEFADSIEETEELKHFLELLDKAQAFTEKEDIKNNLKILEMDHANLEREVLVYDNWLKTHGKDLKEA